MEEIRIISQWRWTINGYRLMVAPQRVFSFNGVEMKRTVADRDWIDASLIGG